MKLRFQISYAIAVRRLMWLHKFLFLSYSFSAVEVRTYIWLSNIQLWVFLMKFNFLLAHWICKVLHSLFQHKYGNYIEELYWNMKEITSTLSCLCYYLRYIMDTLKAIYYYQFLMFFSYFLKEIYVFLCRLWSKTLDRKKTTSIFFN